MWGSSGLSHEPSPLLTCSSIWSSSCPGFNQHTDAERAHRYHSKPLTIRPKYLTPYLTSSPRWKGNDTPKTFFLSNPSSPTHCQQLDTWYQLLRVEIWVTLDGPLTSPSPLHVQFSLLPRCNPNTLSACPKSTLQSRPPYLLPGLLLCVC